MNTEVIKKHFVIGPIKSEFISSELKHLQSETSSGAHNIFLGQVRKDSRHGREVMSIEYSAYEEMAEREIERIIEDMQREYPGIYIKIFHSVGMVNTGENSMLVIVTASHRRDTFRALEKTVDLVKANVPIWKKEIFTDGTSKWIE